MNEVQCLFEQDVVKAVKSNQWTDALRDHANSCPMCRATVGILGALQTLSVEPPAQRLPSAKLIWLKAQYLRREERLSKLDLVGLAGMAAAGLILLSGTLFWRWPGLFPGLMDLFGISRSSAPHELSLKTPMIVSIAVLGFAWLITRDRFFAEHR